MNYTNTPDAPAAIGPYSQAISANGFLFASGQVPLMPGTGEIVGTTIEEQAERACQSIKAILAANGLGFEDVIKTTCFLANMEDFAAFNGVYGKGITPYIQDLTGSGLDFTPNPMNFEQIQTMPMWGWQAAGQINIIPSKLFVSGGYSTVRVNMCNGYYATNEYKRGTYIFGNIFYNLTRNCILAAVYLLGSRRNMDDAHNTANRLNIMIQYNF